MSLKKSIKELKGDIRDAKIISEKRVMVLVDISDLRVVLKSASSILILNKCLQSDSRLTMETWNRGFVVGFWNSDREIYYSQVEAKTIELAIRLFAKKLFKK